MPQPEGHLPQVVKKKEGHMPELRKRRSHLALLGAFAMVASVLAVGASPASATPGTADGTAVYSACVGPATADAGFTDVATGSTHDAAINCIAYYGITRGTSATTFSPNRTIPRWQLAVMLQRASGPAGVTLGAAADQGFTDISDLSSSFQAAINQMAALGVMTGTTATTFDPNGVVSRAVVVEALAGFLTNARVGPGGKALARNVDRSLTLRDPAKPTNSQVIPIDENFRDIGGATYSAYQSIRALAEMGVVSGRGDGTFGPAASVTRGQAASFITRALAHTNARPAGLTMQVNKAAVTASDELSLSVSVRGNDFSIRESVPVDVFSYADRNAAAAFKADGTCQTSGSTRVSDVRGAGGACVIEVDDDVTEPSGNVTVDAETVNQPTTFWAWTGAVGDRLDWNKANLSMDSSVVSDAASVSVTTQQVASSARVTTSVSGDAENDNLVRYGTTVTVTIQLVDSNSQPVGISGQSYQWWATGIHSPTGAGRAIPGTGTKTVTTGADGRATFTLTQNDPDTNPDVDGPGEDADADDMTTWTYYIARVGTAVALADNSDIGFTVSSGQGSGTLVFDDDGGVAETLSVDLARKWTPIPAAGTTGGGRVGVTAKVTDQYGSPLRGHAVYFDLVNNTGVDDNIGCSARGAAPHYLCTAFDTSIDENTGEVMGTVRRLTRSNGTNTVSAEYRATASMTAMVTDRFSRYTVGTDLDGDGNLDDSGEIVSKLHYWTTDPEGWNAEAGTATAATSTTAWTAVRFIDLENNLIVTTGPSGGPRQYIPQGYRYTGDTIFKLFLYNSDDPDEARWVGEAEMERRMALHLKTPGIVAKLENPDDLFPINADMQILQYNVSGRPSRTGVSNSVIVIRFGPSRSLQDPPPSSG